MGQRNAPKNGGVLAGTPDISGSGGHHGQASPQTYCAADEKNCRWVALAGGCHYLLGFLWLAERDPGWAEWSLGWQLVRLPAYSLGGGDLLVLGEARGWAARRHPW